MIGNMSGTKACVTLAAVTVFGVLGAASATANDRPDRARERAPALARRPGPPEKKLKLARQAYELFPNDVGYIAWYAQALSAAGRNDEATAKFDEAMAIEPDHLTVLTRLCEFLASSGRLPAARAVADWLSRLHPGSLAM